MTLWARSRTRGSPWFGVVGARWFRGRGREEDKMVGEAGFEPTISCSQSTRVARLRYSPPFHAHEPHMLPGSGLSR